MCKLDTLWARGARPVIYGLMLIAVIGCQTAPEKNDWLYQQLGERNGISQLTETLLLNIARDDRISDLFQNTDIVRLHRLLTEQFCELSGGSCIYSGDNMRESHRGLHLTSADFNALVEDLVLAMEVEDISVGAQNRLLAQLAPMHRDIVGEHPLSSANRDEIETAQAHSAASNRNSAD